MGTLAKIAAYLTVIAMFLAAGAPLLKDTAPGSDRSIVVAVVGVALAIVALLNALQMRALSRSVTKHQQSLHP
jgi:hypothetical protein